MGAHIYGRAGIILPSAERSLLLIGQTWHLLTKDWPRGKDLGIVGGSWVFNMQFRRPTMAAFDQLWQAVTGNIRLAGAAPALATELVSAICLLPLMRIDLRVKVTGMVSASDASEAGGGVTVSSGLSEQGWSRLGEGERHRQQGLEDGLVLIESFGGIGGARRALELLGITPAAHISIECNPEAVRVTKAAYPGVVHFEDIRMVTASKMREVTRH